MNVYTYNIVYIEQYAVEISVRKFWKSIMKGTKITLFLARAYTIHNHCFFSFELPIFFFSFRRLNGMKKNEVDKREWKKMDRLTIV